MMSKNNCRACLIEDKCENLYDWYLSMDDVLEPLTYQECFQLCTQLDVKKADSVSTYIRGRHYLCEGCVQELLISYRFMRKAQKSANELYSLAQEENENDRRCENIKTNEFECIIVPNLCKNGDEEVKEISCLAAEQVIPEAVITEAEALGTVCLGREAFEKSSLLEDNLEELQNPLLPQVIKTSKRINDSKQSITKKFMQEFVDLKAETRLDILNAFQWDSAVKEEMVEDKAEESSAPITTDAISNEENKIMGQVPCSVKGDGVLNKNEKTKSKVRNVKSSSSRSNERRKRSTGFRYKKTGNGEYKQVACEHCKKLFPENQLKQHKSRYHRPKIFLCDICPTSFSIANNLRRHQRTHDLNRERNFTCEECGRKFFTEDVYRTHIKIHQSTRQPQFKCTECDSAFMHKGSLTLHIQKHTGPKNECNICHKRYVRKIDLEVHMRNHSGDLPYKCSKCGKAFMTTSALRKHELLHTGIRFKCDICSKEYSHPSKLSRHRLEHTGLPLKCAMCNKGFSEPNKIRRHISSVHKVEDIEQIKNLTVRVFKYDARSKKDTTSNMQID